MLSKPLEDNVYPLYETNLWFAEHSRNYLNFAAKRNVSERMEDKFDFWQIYQCRKSENDQ